MLQLRPTSKSSRNKDVIDALEIHKDMISTITDDQKKTLDAVMDVNKKMDELLKEQKNMKEQIRSITMDKPETSKK